MERALDKSLGLAEEFGNYDSVRPRILFSRSSYRSQKKTQSYFSFVRLFFHANFEVQGRKLFHLTSSPVGGTFRHFDILNQREFDIFFIGFCCQKSPLLPRSSRILLGVYKGRCIATDRNTLPHRKFVMGALSFFYHLEEEIGERVPLFQRKFVRTYRIVRLTSHKLW